jgi:FMN phosphatase YigB (HAD superfamily)
VIVAFDLDGTLCNIEHRLHLIRDGRKDWPGFFRACVKDKPVWPVIEAFKGFVDRGHVVDVWSGRSDIVRAETAYWLGVHGIVCHELRMRKEGDYRADDIVKGEWLDAIPKDLRPELAFEDRQRVVDMWRSRGVQCCQVAPGDF